MADRRRPTISDREDEYKQKRRRIIISPDRADPFADGGKTPDVGSRTYTDIMREQLLKGEENELRRKIAEKSKEGTLVKTNFEPAKETTTTIRKRGRWDQTVNDSFVPAKVVAVTPSSAATPNWEEVSSLQIQWKCLIILVYVCVCVCGCRKLPQIIVGMKHQLIRQEVKLLELLRV